MLERIDFSNRNPFNRADLEFTAFAQDHWSFGPKVSLDFGARVEHQRLPGSLRIAPRAGIVMAPFPGERTVFRMGFGQIMALPDAYPILKSAHELQIGMGPPNPARTPGCGAA